MKRRGLWKWLSIAFSLFVATAAIGVSFIDVGYAATSGTIDNWKEEGLSISYNGDAENSWTSDYSQKQIVGSVQSSSGCGTTHYETTLTFTCDLAGTISFDYSVEVNGVIKLNGTNITNGGHFEKELSQGSSVSVYLKSSSTSAANKITITNITLQIPASPASIRFELNSVCSYEAFINGTLATKGTDIDCLLGDKIIVKSPTPANGYKFVGWKKNGVLSGSDTTLNFTVLEPITTIEICAADEKAASFEVNQEIFYDLQDAIDYAKTTSPKIVKLYSSGQVEPKKDGTEYVFDGVNLFIPGTSTSNYSDFAKEIPPRSESTTYSCNYSLKLLGGVSISVQNNSAICVAGKLRKASGGQLSARPVDEVGELCLESGCTINLESGTQLYAWGFVSGEGDIHALSGSTVYEGFAFCFRGGNATSDCIGSKINVFPFNQYFIQNIECFLHMHYGATEKTSVSITMRFVGETKSCFTFIGSDGMFVLGPDSEVIKKYDPKTDRLSMKVVGSGTLSHIVVKINVTVDSAEYVLPIANNMDIIVQGGTVGVEQDLAFLPTSTMKVEEGATLNVGSAHSLFFYDTSNWVGKNYGFLSDAFKLPYVSPYATSDFSKAKRVLNEGAKLIVDGTVECNGAVFMTKPEKSEVATIGKVVSNGGGKFEYVESQYDSAAVTGIKTKQVSQSGNEVTLAEIETCPASFANSDDSIFAGVCPVGAALVFESGFWNAKHQGPFDITITFKNADATTVIGTKTYTISGDAGIELPNQTEFANFQGIIFLWLKEDDASRSYEPNTNITTIRDSVVLIAFTGGWYTDFNKDTFYYDRTIGKIKGLRHIQKEDDCPEDLYCFDENGVLLKNEGQIFVYEQGNKYDGSGDGNIYFVNNGVVQNDKGLASHDIVADGTVKTYYYYFGPSHYAYRNTTCYIGTNLNNLLPAGVYTFGNDGRAEVLECSNFADVDSVTLSADGYCTFGTIKAGIGLFTSGTHIYYAKDDGSITKDGTYYVEKGKLNGKAGDAGLYYFDTNGYLCDSMMNPITVTHPEANA